MSRSAISRGHRGPVTGKQADRCAICDHMRRWHRGGDLSRCSACQYPDRRGGVAANVARGERYHEFAEPEQEEPWKIVMTRLSSGYYHARGPGVCNWGQYESWPPNDDEIALGTFTEASQAFRSALRAIRRGLQEEP